MTTYTDGMLGILGANVKPVPQTPFYGDSLEDYTAQQDYNLPPDLRADQMPQLGDALPGEIAPWDYIITESGHALSARSPDQGAYLAGVQYRKPHRPYDTGISAVSGTATAVGASTLSTGLTWTLNQYADYAISIMTATTGAGQWRPIASNTTAGVITVAKAWSPLPTGTITYKIWAMTEIVRKLDSRAEGQHNGIRIYLCVDSLAETLTESMFPTGQATTLTGAWQYANLWDKTIERQWRVGLARITCQFLGLDNW